MKTEVKAEAMTKREYDRQLAVRLARHFPATNWGNGARGLDLDVAASFLDLHSPEVATMIAAGLLAGEVECVQEARHGTEAFGRVDGAELLRFFEEHGEAWFKSRLEQTIAKLRSDIDEAEVYARMMAERETREAARELADEALEQAAAGNEVTAAAGNEVTA